MMVVYATNMNLKLWLNMASGGEVMMVIWTTNVNLKLG